MASNAESLLEHAGWLRRLAGSLVRDDAAADELVQETWMAALRRPPELGDSPRPWLRRVITNVARFRWRGEKNRAAREAAAAAGAGEAAPSTDELLERHELQQLLARLVGELEEPYRTTLLLRYAEGLPAVAIAQRLGIPAGTVRSRLHQALERLRVRLDAAHRGDRRAWMLALGPLAHPPGGGIGASELTRLPRASGAAARRGAARPVLAGAAAVAAIVLAVLAISRRGDGDGDRDGAASARRPSTAAGGGAATAGSRDSARTALEPTVLPSDTPGWMGLAGARGQRVAGVVLAGNKPLANIRVRLTSDVSRTGLVPPVERRTDAHGRFDLGEQPARVYQIGAAAPGALAAVEQLDLRDPTAQPAPDALELVLQPCRASLHGTITDAAGTPIAGAEILREDVIGPVTGVDGAYDICVRPSAVASHELRLTVRAPGYGALMIDVAPAGRVRHDLVLTPEAVIEGRAVAADGAPVAGARIAIERADVDFRRATEQSAPLIAATDADGRFRFDELAGGEHRLSGAGRGQHAPATIVTVPAGETRTVTLTMVPAAIVRGRVIEDGRPVAGARVTFAERGDAAAFDEAARRRFDGSGAPGTIARSQLDGSFVIDQVPVGSVALVAAPYRLRAPARPVIAGDNELTLEVERAARVHGVVRRAGAAVAQARVCLWSRDASNACVYADRAGRYAVDGLSPGAYHAFADDRVIGAAMHDLELSVASGGEQTLDLELSAAGRIRGVVVDAAGVPVVGAQVDMFGVTAQPVTRSVTDHAGRFECTMMIAGTYTPTVVAGPGQGVPLRFATPPPRLRLDGDDHRLTDVRLVVDATRVTLLGLVVDGGGAPVPDARVRAWSEDHYEPAAYALAPSGATNADGRFRLAGLAPGRYAVEIRTADGFRSVQAADVAPGAAELRLVVDRARCENAPPVALPPMGTRAATPLVWDGRVRLLGWDVPARVERGVPFEISLYFEVLAPLDHAWKVFVHLDGDKFRAGVLDHEPAGGACPATTWRRGHIIVDRVTSTIGPHAPAGTYHVWTGFFTGLPPNWKNLPVSDAPPDQRDDRYRRIRIASFTLGP